MNSNNYFYIFFKDRALDLLLHSIDLALDEDGRDLTSEGIFSPHDQLRARIITKEKACIAGLGVIPLIFERLTPDADVQVDFKLQDGQCVPPQTELVQLTGPARLILKAERVILNFLSHLSGIATLTRSYTSMIEHTNVRLLDTRKTLPGLRYPEKYAVIMGGGLNHRLNLEEMLMVKDNHIDRSGSITDAVNKLRSTYSPCPPIEVECRTLDQVRKALGLNPHRIMLDNMDLATMRKALQLIPQTIETEISGGVDLDSLMELAGLAPDYISAGRITHSAPAIDLSLQYLPE